ncbi:MAG TPA: hypothetical protein VIH35_05030 [Kiritimatiellia bacterium]|jgi:hypothetical protein
MNPASLPMLLARLGLVGGLAAYSSFFFTARMNELGDHASFMHLVHLVFHEAGHVLLIWASPLWHSLGGTLGQLAVPLVLVLSFAIKNRDGFGASICGWWLGHSLVDVAPYINDARKMQLTLLGGETGMEVEGHDWNFILDQLGLLKIDVYLSRDVLLAGRLVMALSLLAAMVFAGLPWLKATFKPAPADAPLP